MVVLAVSRAHLVHALVLGGWAVAVGLAVAVDHLVTSARERTSGEGRSGPADRPTPESSRRMVPINAAAFIATWPPPPGMGANVTGRFAARPPRPAALATSTLLQVGAAANLLAASVHLAVAPDHLAQSSLYGSFFLVVAGLQIGLAVALVVAPRPRLVRVVATGSAAVVVLWAYSRLVGVPIGPDGGGTESLGVLDGLATAAELVSMVAALCLWSRDRLRPAWSPRQWAASVRWALPVVAVAAGYLIWVSPKG